MRRIALSILVPANARIAWADQVAPYITLSLTTTVMQVVDVVLAAAMGFRETAAMTTALKIAVGWQLAGSD